LPHKGTTPDQTSPIASPEPKKPVPTNLDIIDIAKDGAPPFTGAPPTPLLHPARV